MRRSVETNRVEMRLARMVENRISGRASLLRLAGLACMDFVVCLRARERVALVSGAGLGPTPARGWPTMAW